MGLSMSWAIARTLKSAGGSSLTHLTIKGKVLLTTLNQTKCARLVYISLGFAMMVEHVMSAPTEGGCFQ
jgi:hypothetical protein